MPSKADGDWANGRCITRHDQTATANREQVSYVVFTDDPARFGRLPAVSVVLRQDLGWPLTAMLRYRSFLDSWHLLAHADFIFRSLARLYPQASQHPAPLALAAAPCRAHGAKLARAECSQQTQERSRTRACLGRRALALRPLLALHRRVCEREGVRE